jgi:hypothetical protein
MRLVSHSHAMHMYKAQKCVTNASAKTQNSSILP